jgi:hypothetical protein
MVARLGGCEKMSRLSFRRKEAFMSRPHLFAAPLLAAIAAAAGCSSNPAPPVPVEGSKVSALRGKWIGEYSSKDTGRTGNITFELKLFEKTARGSVLMVPKDAYAPDAPTSGAGAAATMPQVLQILFVDSSGGVVNGTMDTYVDPRCNCRVNTTFEGTITGDSISGTYRTIPQEGDSAITTGVWHVTKQKE